MPIYEQATDEMREVLADVTKRYHGQLNDYGVTIDMLAAYPKTDENGDPTGPAIKHQGYIAFAVVRKIPYKDRVAGRGDAEIVVDGERWEELSDDERAALIDHELCHLDVATDKDGNVKRDDLDRVKFNMRSHDVQLGVFNDVVRRHGKLALDFQHGAEFVNNVYEQLWLPFAEKAEEGAA